MRNLKFITLLLIALAFSNNIYSQYWDWAHGILGSDMTFSQDICTDNQGNVYITGDCQIGSISFNGIQTPYVNGGTCFVAKLDSLGNILLFKMIYNAEGRKIAVDDNQNIYVHGWASVLFNFANTTYFYDKFLVKYDSLGNEIYAKDFSNIWTPDLEVSSTGNIGFIAGYSGTFSLDTFQFLAQGFAKILVGEMDANGNYLWFNTYGNSIGGIYVDVMSYDNFDNIIIGGSFSETLAFGSFVLQTSNTYTYRPYITKIANGGTGVLASKTYPYNFTIVDIEVDSNNDLIINLLGGGGGLIDTFFLDGIPVINAPSNQYGPAILFKMTFPGSAVWAKAINTNSHIYRTNLAINQFDEIAMVGTVFNNNSGLPRDIFIGDTTLYYNFPNNYSDYPFLLKFNNDGDFQMGEIIHVGGGQNETNGICIDANNDIYITGFMSGQVLYFSDDTAITNYNGYASGFVAKYKDCSFHELVLQQGWSIISSFVEPTNSLVEDIFSSVDTSLIILKSGDGDVYWPQFLVNSIVNWDIHEGYQVKMSEINKLKFYGDYITPETTLMEINEGWQIIGYLRRSPISLDTVFSVFSLDIAIIKNGEGEVYWPFYNFNAIGNLHPGEGYQIKSLSNFSFNYPAE